MIIKAVDIARELGISKATVSLALNGKTGVSEKTKKAIFECKDRLENHSSNSCTPLLPITPPQMPTNTLPEIIKVIVLHHNLKVMLNTLLDLWTPVAAVFQKATASFNYISEITYWDADSDSLELLIKSCNDASVAGVIVIATELTSTDYPLLKKINKPLVIMDHDSGQDWTCVTQDDYDTVLQAVKLLRKRGISQILYLKRDIDIYNYQERRNAFQKALSDYPDLTGEIANTSVEVPEIRDSILHYLEQNGTPQAILTEDYHLSIALFQALSQKRLKPGKDLLILGIDCLPEYFTGGMHLSAFTWEHAEKAKLALMLLYHEIHFPSIHKTKTSLRSIFLEGDTI